MQNQIFEAASGIANPWYVKGVDFDVEQKRLSLHIDFVAGSGFAYPDVEGAHPVHDTQIKRYRPSYRMEADEDGWTRLRVWLANHGM